MYFSFIVYIGLAFIYSFCHEQSVFMFIGYDFQSVTSSKDFLGLIRLEAMQESRGIYRESPANLTNPSGFVDNKASNQRCLTGRLEKLLDFRGLFASLAPSV